MTELVRIGFDIATADIDKANRGVDSLLKKVESLDNKKIGANTKKSLDETTRAAERAGREIQILSKQKENLEKGFSKSLALSAARMQVAGVPQATVDSYTKARKAVDDLSGSMNRIRISSTGGVQAISAFGVSLGTVVSFGIAKTILELADNFNLLQAKVKLVTPANVSLKGVTEELVNIANSNLISIQDTINLYTKLVPAIRAVGGGYREALSVSDSFAKALRVGGANAREASAATIQFAQALGSGKLAGDRKICHPTK